MPDVTLTEAQLAEIEARAKDRRAYERRTVSPPLTSGSLYNLDEIDRLIAALRANRERERRYETALGRIADGVADNDHAGHCHAYRRIARAALGEEVPNVA